MYHIINAGKNIITIVQKLYVDTVIITSEYALAGNKYNTYNAEREKIDPLTSSRREIEMHLSVSVSVPV